jgi:hypothetical protein
MRLVAGLLVALLCALAAPTAAGARDLYGLGDQDPATYASKRVHALHLQTARYVVNWNWFRDPAKVALTDRWVAAAQAAGLRPLISLSRDWRPRGLHHPPTVAQYLQSFELLHWRYPAIRDFGVWNEANHKTQPLHRKPRLAARYYNAMRSACRRCEIVAADVLDDPAMPGWIATFKRYAHHPRLWGLHNYRDVNRLTGSTRGFLRQVKGTVWLTEIGGIRRTDHRRADGSKRARYRRSLVKQAAAVRRVFTIARASRRITRVYFYQWQQITGASWDSAFLNADGTVRPALKALRSELGV